jgi:Uma2 family endonuclease
MIAPSDVQLDPANVFQPDLYFIRTERLGIIDEQGPKGPPDLVAEIVSQGSRRQDLGPKKITYAARGVIEYWAILPRTREVQVFLLQEESEKPARILTVNDVLESSLLPGLEIPLTEMFED